jgi:hypothetical protein
MEVERMTNSFTKVTVPLNGSQQIVTEAFDFIDIDTLNTTADITKVYVRIDDQGMPSKLSDLVGTYVYDSRKITLTWDSSQTGLQVVLVLGRGCNYYSYRGIFELAREDIGLMSLLTGVGANVNLVNSQIILPVEIQSNYKTNLTLYSGTVTASGNSNDLDFSLYKYVEIELSVTSIGGTSPSLDFFVDGKFEGSGDYKTLVSQTNITATGSYYFTINPLIFRYIRVRWNANGTSPSITFAVYAQVMA